jgi:hypothetical protein
MTSARLRVAPLTVLAALAMLLAAPSAALAQSLPIAAFTSTTFSTAPGSSLALVGVALSEPPLAPVTVNVMTTNGTAVAGVDYVQTNTSLTWQVGDPPLKVFAIMVASSEPVNREFNVYVISAWGAGFGTPLSASVQLEAAAPGAPGNAVTLSWIAPTENSDGTPLTDLRGYYIRYGTNPELMPYEIGVSPDGGQQTYVIDGLASTTWFFEVLALNSAGIESSPSPIVYATL